MAIEQVSRVENLQLEQNRMHALMRLHERLQTPEETSLWENQMSMVQALHAFLQTGKTSGYMSEPTGSGKTAVILEVANLLGLKTVVLSPTKQLLRQTHGKSQEFTPNLDISNYYSSEKNLDGQVVNTTYQSMLRLSRKQNEDLKLEEVGLVICDEVDLALGEETHSIFRKFPNAIKIGMTATPYFDPILGYKQRGIVKEDEEWTGLFTNLIHEMSLEEAMERGILIGSADIHLIKSNIVVSDIEIQSGGEYRKSDVKRVFDKASRNMLVVGMVAGIDKLSKNVVLSEDQKKEIDAIHNKIAGKKTFIFAIDIDHANALTQQLSEQEISARGVHGKTEGDINKILRAHAKGEIQALVGVDILGRGVDSPSTEVSIHLRPTRSGRVLAQQFGRVLRQSSETGKEKAISIQVVDQFADKADAPILIPDLFDPEYVLRGVASGKKPSESRRRQLHERPIVTFSGMDIDVIMQDAKTRDLLKKRFTQGSVKEIVDFADGLFAQIKNENSSITSYDLIKEAVEQLPQKMPREAQEKAMQAIASMDVNTRTLGKKAFLLLNMRTLLSVVNSFYTEEIDSPEKLEERGEMLISAIAYVMGKVDAGMTINSQVSGRINQTARDGIVEFLREKYDLPIGLIRDPQNRLFVLTKVEEEFENEFSSGDSIENLASELSEETGAKKEEILNWLMFLNADRESERKKLSLEQERDIYFSPETSGLKEQMADVLYTLAYRERRVLELRFGLEDGREGTHEEIGREFGVTRERIRQIEAKALRRLRHPARSRRLRDFLDAGEHAQIPIKKIDISNEVDLSINRLNLGSQQKILARASGIREIGDFFSASPEEIAEEWLGSSQGLAGIMERHLIQVLDKISNQLKTGKSLLPEEMEIFTHITDAILYRMNREPKSDLAERIGMYEKAYDEIVAFIKQFSVRQVFADRDKFFSDDDNSDPIDY